MDSSGASAGVIAGVSVAAGVLLLAIILVVIYCYVKLRNNVKTVRNVEVGKADSSWSTKASSNYTTSTHDKSETSRVSNITIPNNHNARGPDSSQELSSISSSDSVFGYNNVSFNPNADDKDRRKKVAFHSKHVYSNEAFDSTGTGDSSFERIKYKKNENRNGSISREARAGSRRKTRQRNSSVDKDSVDSRRRSSGERQSRSQEISHDKDRQSSSGQTSTSTSSMQRTHHSGTRSSGRSRSRSSGRRSRSSGRSGSHGRRDYARSASSDSSRRSSHKSSLPPEQRPSISNMYANRGFRDDEDRSPSPDRDQADAAGTHPESQV